MTSQESAECIKHSRDALVTQHVRPDPKFASNFTSSMEKMHGTKKLAKENATLLPNSPLYKEMVSLPFYFTSWSEASRWGHSKPVFTMLFSVSVLFLIVYAPSTLFTLASQCKPLPGDSNWPSSTAWQGLNSSVSGRLVTVFAPGAVCHPNQTTFNNAACATLKTQWTNSSLHASNPFSVDYNDVTCYPDASAPCSTAGYPAYAIEAESTADVQAGIQFAKDTGIRLSIKGTGHDYPGRSHGPGSLEIWMHRMLGLSLSIQDSTAQGTDPIGSLKISAGMQWRNVYAHASANKYTVVAGSDPDVGVSGWVLGGGHGPVSSLFGTGADQVLEFEVVTADGEYRVINEENDSDLFWAMRGGGPSFAVMLSVTVRVFSTVPGATVYFSYYTSKASDTFWNLGAHFSSHLPALSDAGAMGYYGIVPDNGNSDPSTAGMLDGNFIFPGKTVEETYAILTPFVNDINGEGWATDPITNTSSAYPFDSFSTLWSTNPAYATGLYGRLGSWLLDAPALNGSVETLKTQFQKSTPYPGPGVLLGHLLAGPRLWAAQARAVGGTTAVLPAWRKTYVHLSKFLEYLIHNDLITDNADAVTTRLWTPLDAAEKAAVTTELRNSGIPALKQLAPDLGAYLSETDPSNPDWQQDYYGSNYPRLLEIKQKWDPTGIFWCKPCVGHELWEIVDGPSGEDKLEWGIGQSPGRLCRN